MLPDVSAATLFGVAGVSCGAGWTLHRSKTTIMMTQALCSACFITHDLLIGAISGGSMSILSLTQSLIICSGRRNRLLTTLYLATLPAMVALTALTGTVQHRWPRASA